MLDNYSILYYIQAKIWLEGIMTPLDIRIELLKNGLTLAELGRKCGAHRNLVRYAIRGRAVRGKVIQIRREIAKAIGKPVEEIWPESDRAKAA